MPKWPPEVFVAENDTAIAVQHSHEGILVIQIDIGNPIPHDNDTVRLNAVEYRGFIPSLRWILVIT